MAYRYKLTPLAVSDMDEALGYISEKLQNPGAAENLFRATLREIRLICDSPYTFPDCSYYLIADDTIRHSVIGNYVLIFAIAEDEKMIHILRFLYGARDITNMDIQ